jgi:uncharacterized protein
VLPPRYERLVEVIRGYGRCVVAFSGGADSSLVARAAHDALAGRALAVTGASASIPPREVDHARRVAGEIGIAHRVVSTHEQDDASYRANPVDRCYYCKRELFSTLARLAREEAFDAVLSGDNTDDLADHRPGRRAALEAGVRFPLQEAGLTKSEVREMSRALGLPTWDKPASPCLASRVAYGEAIDPVVLARIDSAEEFVRRLGIAVVRVRHHRDVARIEVPEADIDRLMAHRAAVVDRLRALGWPFVSMDLSGFRSGSMNLLVPGARGARGAREP